MNLPPTQTEEFIHNLKITGQQYFDLADKLLDEVAEGESEENNI